MKVWLSNMHDPEDINRLCANPEEEYWHSYWLKDKIIGKPRPARGRTVKQTEDMKLVGVYAEMSVWKWIGRLFRGWW